MLRHPRGPDEKGKKSKQKASASKRRSFHVEDLTALEFFILLCSGLFVGVFFLMQGVMLYKLHQFEAPNNAAMSSHTAAITQRSLSGAGHNGGVVVNNRQRLELAMNASKRPFIAWPPLDEIVDKSGNITGNPQFLLDFAIIGFDKAGTKTLKLMIGGHGQVDCPLQENYKLYVNKPAEFIYDLYDMHPNEDYKRCYNNNGDIFEPSSLRLIEQYFPETKIMIALRHPVRHFESLYNARIQNLPDPNKVIPLPHERIGQCGVKDEGVCTDHAHYALWLYKFGKTLSMPNSPIEDIIKNAHAYEAHHTTVQTRNKIFLTDMSQLIDHDWFRTQTLLEDIQIFLGLEHPFLNGIPPAHPAPRSDTQDIRDKRKIDICQPQYKTLREELMLGARESSVWIRERFVKSPDVFVSSPDFFEQALISWMEDPCDQKKYKHKFDTKTIEGEIAFEAKSKPLVPVKPGELRIYDTSATWPPVNEIVDKSGQLIADPQFLLDFSIIGIEKCGTSTLMQWLGNHPEVFCFQQEDFSLYFNKPGQLVKRLYDHNPGEKIKRGYKNPIDIFQPCVLRNFKELFPKTNLLLTIRHPVRYFESLYNFRIQNLPDPNDPFTPPLERIGICNEYSQGVCTDHAHFALWMYRLGKTLDLPKTEMQQSIIDTHPYEAVHYTYPSTNKVFLTEMSQFSDKDSNRKETLKQDLATFLELERPFKGDTPHAKPGMKWSKEVQAIRDSRKINICDEMYRSLRAELMKGARETSVWIRASFLQSKDVFVSSPEFFNEIMKTWMVDPCDDSDSDYDPRANSNWPALSSLVDDDDQIVGDVQFLLDFAIIGIEKCGTSTVMVWLGSHPEIQCSQEEDYNLMHDTPGQLVRELYDKRSYEEFKRGYKNPIDIFYPKTSLAHLHRYFPKTKLFITLRHPVRYFESLHNFRIQNHNEGNWNRSHIATAFDRIGPCIGNAGDGCTERAHFGLWLYQLGKTLSLSTTETEKTLLQKHPKGTSSELPTRMENPIFLTEITQLADTDPDRQSTLQNDLKRFLGITKDFNTTAPHKKPGKKWKAKIQAVRDSFKIDICEEQFQEIRDILMEGARETSIWVRESFIKADDVFISNPEFFEKAMLAWMDDPCDAGTKRLK